MNRLGWTIAALLALAVLALVTVARLRPTTPERPAPPRIASAPPVPPAGSLMIPVEGVAPGALVDSWGDARGDGAREHHAIDIMAPVGTPVVAAAAGRIEKLFESRLGGHTVYERSADGGTVYYYAHLDRYAPGLAEGRTVGAGERIASVGASGDADPAAPHLHFEIHRMAPGEGWWQGTEVNPYPLLKQALPIERVGE